MTFTCDHCGGTFPTDDDNDHGAALEMDALFSPRENASPQAQICDGCFHAFEYWRHQRRIGDKLREEVA